MFQSVVALALADLTISSWTHRSPDADVLHHYGEAISKLRSALLNEDQLHEDALIFAIMALIAVDYLIGNLPSFRAHLYGMRRIIQLRGGIDALGWQAYLRPGIISLESFWQYLCGQPHLSHLTTTSTPTTVDSSASTQQPPTPPPPPMLQFPLDNPNPTEAPAQIQASLPSGFRGLATRKLLSAPLTHTIHALLQTERGYSYDRPTTHIHPDGIRKFLNFKDQHGRPITTATTLRFSERIAVLLSSPNLTPTHVDRLCCIALFFYLLGFTRAEQCSQIYAAQLRHYTAELSRLDFAHEQKDPEIQALMAWAMFMVASTLLPVVVGPSMSRVDDVRSELAVKVVTWYWPRNDWQDMERLFSGFVVNESCIETWRALWEATVCEVSG
jgi:hypothetical protein